MDTHKAAACVRLLFACSGWICHHGTLCVPTYGAGAPQSHQSYLFRSREDFFCRGRSKSELRRSKSRIFNQRGDFLCVSNENSLGGGRSGAQADVEAVFIRGAPLPHVKSRSFQIASSVRRDGYSCLEKKQITHRLPPDFVLRVLADFNAGFLDSPSAAHLLGIGKTVSISFAAPSWVTEHPSNPVPVVATIAVTGLQRSSLFWKVSCRSKILPIINW